MRKLAARLVLCSRVEVERFRLGYRINHRNGLLSRNVDFITVKGLIGSVTTSHLSLIEVIRRGTLNFGDFGTDLYYVGGVQ